MELLIILAFLYSLYRLVCYWERKAARDKAKPKYPSATIRNLDETEEAIGGS